MSRLMVVDDESSVQDALRMILQDDHEVNVFANGDLALDWLKTNDPNDVDVVLLDVVMPGTPGLDVLREIKNAEDSPEVVMVTATKTVKTVVDAMKAGAFDYVTKPFDVDEVKLVIDKAVERKRLIREIEFLRSEVAKPFQPRNLIGQSSAIKEIMETIDQLAPSNSSVLIRGESGTGKEMVARALHYHPKSQRKNRAFVPIDCNTIPASLLESELFGHEKGAFTGAEKKLGRAETADGGTLFLDEIGELTNEVQVKLLRFLDERRYTRVGGTESKKLDVRVLAATNRNLEKAIEDGTFRNDLFYRINVVPVYLPPLRKRKEDVPDLAQWFLEQCARESGVSVRSLSTEAMDALIDYGWPGNIRELRNVMERLTVLSRNGSIALDKLPAYILQRSDDNREAMLQDFEAIKKQVFSGNLTLESADEYFLSQLITDALVRSKGVQTKAAEMLSTSRRSLKYQMDKLGIRAEDFQEK